MLTIFIVIVVVINCGFEFLNKFIKLTYTAVKPSYSKQNKVINLTLYMLPVFLTTKDHNGCSKY